MWEPKFRLSSVDGFQGEENDIVIISFVRNNVSKRIGFLDTYNRINVALSRAKHGLYCFGNFTMFAEKCELWKSIVNKLRVTESIGTSLLAGCYCKPVVIETYEKLVEANKHYEWQSKNRLRCGCR